MAKGQYKKRKRTSKYEEKVAIDATFNALMKVALNKWEPLNKPITFVYPKTNMLAPKMDPQERRKFLIEKYSIKIPDIIISKLAIEIQVIESLVPPAIQISILKKIQNEKLELYESAFKDYMFKPNEKEAVIKFEKMKRNIVYDTITIDCSTNEGQVILKVWAYLT